MHLSGLDPSMLLGFLCRDLSEWEGLRGGVEDVSVFFSLLFTFFSSLSLSLSLSLRIERNTDELRDSYRGVYFRFRMNIRIGRRRIMMMRV